MSSEAGLFFGLYETHGINGLWIFLLVTVVMGGAAAIAAGRALADGWGDVRFVALHAALLAAATRFIQYSLFDQPLLSLPAYLIDALILLGLGYLGYRTRRATQMARQYSWLYVQTSPVNCRNKV